MEKQSKNETLQKIAQITPQEAQQAFPHKPAPKPFFSIPVIILGIIGIVVLFIIILGWLFLAPFLKNITPGMGNNNQANSSNEISTLFGVRMNSACSTKFQDFINNYGEDYSKCLTDFIFNQDSCSGFNPDTQGLSDVNIIVILDASGSMAEKIGSQPKIDIAKSAVSNFLTKLPQGVNTGLIVYGNIGSNLLTDKSLSCKGVQEVVKLGNNNSNNVIAAMNSFTPKGWTPIAGSIDFAKNIFKGRGQGDKNYLILVSDGIESCDGNPQVAAEDLKAAISNINLNVIGFTQDFATEQYLESVATLGGGSYLTASNASSIARAFNNELIVIKKDCLSVTLYQMFSRNNVNNKNNQKCWFDAYGREANNFSAYIAKKADDPECNLEMSNALQNRRNDFWYKQEDVAAKNAAIYKKIEANFNAQLQALDDEKNNNF